MKLSSFHKTKLRNPEIGARVGLEQEPFMARSLAILLRGGGPTCPYPAGIPASGMHLDL